MITNRLALEREPYLFAVLIMLCETSLVSISGRPGSRVSGIMLRDGRFEGKILHGDEDFFIERAENYFNQEYISKEDFHSVSMTLQGPNFGCSCCLCR